MNFTELNNRVIKWADDKGILTNATPLTQHSKTQEEVEELSEALFYQSKDEREYINTKGVLCTTSDEIEDAIGDILVTVLIQARLQNLDPLACLETALDIIEKRTGKMENGTFVKD